MVPIVTERMQSRIVHIVLSCVGYDNCLTSCIACMYSKGIMHARRRASQAISKYVHLKNCALLSFLFRDLALDNSLSCFSQPLEDRVNRHTCTRWILKL